MLSDLLISSFILIFVCAHFWNKMKKYQFWKSLKYYSILESMKNDIRFEYVPRKKKKNFDKNIYNVRFKYVPLKNVWFCFISIVWVHFNHKTEKLQFIKSLEYCNVFLSKKKFCQIWICPVKQCLIWFNLRCLSRILVISWEIRILNFIEIVSYFSI